MSPTPTPSHLSDYISSYFSNAHSGAPSSFQQHAFLESVAQIRIAHVTKYLRLNEIKASSVFEVGPGQGYFAKHWISLFPNTEYKAYEVDSSCHDNLGKIGVELVDPDDIDFADLIVLSHVLEHVSDPRGFLEAQCARLRAGGALFIEVPCDDWKFKPEDEPHLLFFNKLSMFKLLSLHGFTDIQLSYHGRTIRDISRGFSLRYSLDRINAAIIRRLPWYGQLSNFKIDPLSEPNLIAAALPLRPHYESQEPACWLRAIARRPC
jgi:hypothetical protein